MKTKRRAPYHRKASRSTISADLRVPAATIQQAGTYVRDPIGAGLTSPQATIQTVVAYVTTQSAHAPLNPAGSNWHRVRIHGSSTRMLNLATSTWRNLTPQEDAYLNWVNNACVALADLPSRAPTRSAFVQLHTAKPQTSRIFEGEVKAIQDKKAWVTMTEHGATEPLIGTCDADTLAQNHIGIGDRFRFVIRRSNGELNAVFEKYPRGTADQSEVQRVQDKFADVTVNGS